MAGMPYPPIVCTVCFIGALLALASGKAERRQVHPLEIALLALLVQRRQLHPLERDSSKKVCGTITFLLLLHQIIRHDTLAYDRLNSIIVNK